MDSQDALWFACKKWVEDNKVRCEESIYQMDSVVLALPELAEIVCKHIGFYKDE